MQPSTIDNNRLNDLLTILIEKGVKIGDKIHLNYEVRIAITKADPYQYLVEQCEEYKLLQGSHKYCLLCDKWHPPIRYNDNFAPRIPYDAPK
jgi:hypothetical protein